MTKEKVKIIIQTRNYKSFGWFWAYIAKEEKDRAVLTDGREIIKRNNKWVYIID